MSGTIVAAARCFECEQGILLGGGGGGGGEEAAYMCNAKITSSKALRDFYLWTHPVYHSLRSMDTPCRSVRTYQQKN